MDQDTYRIDIWGEHPTATLTTGPRSRFERQDRAEAIRALTKDRDVVYALGLADGTIKIGNTRSLDARRGHYPGSEVLAFRFGDYNDEQAIHTTLRASVAHGREYYHPTPEVLAVVNEMRDEFNLPHIAA